ncbi:hypothetical protein IFM89_017615 [Coptis chinensis]|uniref:Uncharacterized protein n=1 Tax=Coptis chinensis TaxID=261450 RepID=A0A835GXY8_9MAGN|nr:hypothetical protein IFM89_017615 [Coptis chinensis]
MKFVAILEFYEMYFKEFAKDARAICRWDIEDLNMESVIMQEICGTIFREAAQDAERRLNLMKMKYEGQNERLVSLEASVLESEKALNSVIEEKDQLNHKLVKISALLEEKEKVALETGSKLMKEKERTDLLYQDLSLFKDQAIQQEKLVSVTERESNMIKSKLEEALGQTHLYEDKIAKLNKKLKLAIEDLEEANKEMKRLQVIIQQKENALSLVVARESGQKKQVELLSTYVERLFKTAADFEGQTMEIVEKNNLRLKRLKFQLYPLVQNPALSRKSELVYKERLERRYSDLQKAEAEVDLLGDEVDALLSLLEKIYIGLNHYSPILQHYPGALQ